MNTFRALTWCKSSTSIHIKRSNNYYVREQKVTVEEYIHVLQLSITRSKHLSLTVKQHIFIFVCKNRMQLLIECDTIGRTMRPILWRT